MPTDLEHAAHDAIVAANARFADAVWRKDKSALVQLYTVDTLLLPPNKPMIQGRDAVVAYWERAFSNPDVRLRSKLEPLEIRVMGELACEVGRVTVIAARDGQEQVVDTGKYVVIWKRDGHQWKMHRDIFNSDVAPNDAQR